MALTAKSALRYGIEINSTNYALDFKISPSGDMKLASLRYGFYTPSTLAVEVKRALEEKDLDNTYTVTINRNVGGGTQNRLTISTSGTYLALYFLTGPRNNVTCATTLGFLKANYLGQTSYTGQMSTGIVVVPNYIGYNYLSPDMDQRNFGVVNISAIGVKEAITFQIQQFWQVQFKYITKYEVEQYWTPLMRWLIQQRMIEFIPEITRPDIWYDGTLESTNADGKGLAFKFTEMLPQFPNNYDTGIMRFRRRIETSMFF